MKNDTWVLDYHYLSLLLLYNKWVHACALMYLVGIYLQRFDNNKQSFHVQFLRRILMHERPSSFPINKREYVLLLHKISVGLRLPQQYDSVSFTKVIVNVDTLKYFLCFVLQCYITKCLWKAYGLKSKIVMIYGDE